MPLSWGQPEKDAQQRAYRLPQPSWPQPSLPQPSWPSLRGQPFVGQAFVGQAFVGQAFVAKPSRPSLRWQQPSWPSLRWPQPSLATAVVGHSRRWPQPSLASLRWPAFVGKPSLASLPGQALVAKPSLATPSWPSLRGQAFVGKADQVLFQEMEDEINCQPLLLEPGIDLPHKAHEVLALATQLGPLEGASSASQQHAIIRNAVRLRGHPTSDAYGPHRASWPL